MTAVHVHTIRTIQCTSRYCAGGCLQMIWTIVGFAKIFYTRLFQTRTFFYMYMCANTSLDRMYDNLKENTNVKKIISLLFAYRVLKFLTTFRNVLSNKCCNDRVIRTRRLKIIFTCIIYIYIYKYIYFFKFHSHHKYSLVVRKYATNYIRYIYLFVNVLFYV